MIKYKNNKTRELLNCRWVINKVIKYINAYFIKWVNGEYWASQVPEASMLKCKSNKIIKYVKYNFCKYAIYNIIKH